MQVAYYCQLQLRAHEHVVDSLSRMNAINTEYCSEDEVSPTGIRHGKK